MKRILLLILCLPLISYSQSIKRSTLSSFGATVTDGNTTLTTTFGQPSNIGTVNDGNSYLRQGFQQPFDDNVILGCTNPFANNYDSLATYDDGSCCIMLTGLADTILKCDSLLTISSNSGYSYLWSTGDTSQNITISSSGMYALQILDGGCSLTDSVYVHDYFHSFSFSDYSMGFEINEDISGWLIEDVNTDGTTWQQGSNTGVNQSVGMFYNYHLNNSANDWLFSQCFILDSSVNYDLSYYFRVASQTYPENLSVYIGTQQNSGAMNTVLQVQNNLQNTLYDSTLINFSVPQSGTYYIGWKAHSNANMWRLDLDNINLGIYQEVLGCTDSTAINYNWQANVDDGSCITIVFGCTDNTAFNFDSLANIDDGSCCMIAGCTVPNALNFNPNACYDDGSCMFCVWGCTDINAPNYNPLATCNDGSCLNITLFGCTDSIAVNYYPAATVDDGTCIYVGCTDSLAVNFDSLASIDDGSCIYNIYGCTDPIATNYDPTANIDDGSCTYPNVCGNITGVFVDNIIHDRAWFNWDDMNSITCVVDQIRFRYREVGTNAWSTKTMGAPVGNSAPCLNTSKRVINLTASTQYEYDFKIWYQDGTVVTWHAGGTFTTADPCLNATNVTAIPVNSTKTDFCWDAPAAAWSFVRLKYRVDSGGSWSNIGGMGVMSPLLCKTKNGLTPSTTYRVIWRTFCNPTGGPYRSPQWDGPVIWTQPQPIKIEGSTMISNLDVYPNPSRDIFNINFNSEEHQDIKVRILNLIGEELYIEELNNFNGEYIKQINMSEYSKAFYFLEIETINGTINKKLILQ